MRMLDKNPNNRFQTAIEVARALQRTAILAEPGVASAGDGSLIVDDLMTSLMSKPLADEMPRPTRVPEFSESRVDQLIFYSEDEPTRVIPFDRPVLTVGRASDQDIVLTGDKVSRRHVRIERGLGDLYRVIDLGSKNGTYLGNISSCAAWRRHGIRASRSASAAIGFGSNRRAASKITITVVGTVAASVTLTRRASAMIASRICRWRRHHRRWSRRKSASSSVRRRCRSCGAVGQSACRDHQPLRRRRSFSRRGARPAAGLGDAASQPLYLLPNTRDSVSITFHPPMNSASGAGGHAVEVRVSAVRRA